MSSRRNGERFRLRAGCVQVEKLHQSLPQLGRTRHLSAHSSNFEMKKKKMKLIETFLRFNFSFLASTEMNNNFFFFKIKVCLFDQCQLQVNVPYFIRREANKETNRKASISIRLPIMRITYYPDFQRSKVKRTGLHIEIDRPGHY